MYAFLCDRQPRQRSKGSGPGMSSFTRMQAVDAAESAETWADATVDCVSFGFMLKCAGLNSCRSRRIPGICFVSPRSVWCDA